MTGERVFEHCWNFRLTVDDGMIGKRQGRDELIDPLGSTEEDWALT